jgi:hypothetical protein
MKSPAVEWWGPEPMRHLRAGALVVCLAVLLAWGCGGTGPQPSPLPPPPPPPVNNTPPQIKSLALSDARAEVGVPLTLTATVEDVETPVANLTYAWTADTGTFSGTGAVVTWVAGQDAPTPADVVLTLTVTERYTSGSTPAENKVTSTTTVRLNNSPKELTELSLRFLGNFANSKVSPETCVAEFTDTCTGKKDELSDVQRNRHDFEIMGSTLRHTGLSIASNRLTATVNTFCSFTSRVITTQPLDPGCANGACPFGSVGTTSGTCRTTSVYEKGRWWLCTSTYASQSLVPSAFERAFFGIRGGL